MKMVPENQTKEVVIVAIIALVIIECVALFNGIDGILLGTVIAAIAGLAGWSAPQLIIKKLK